jgi:hypothetical protein
MGRTIGVLVGFLVLALAASAPGATPPEGQAGAVPPEPLVFASTAPEPSGTNLLAVGGAGVGTVVYAPFKAVVLCPLMAAASGVSLVLPVRSSTSAYLLDVGCRGTYLVTPAMVRGRAEFRGGGTAALATLAPLRPVQRAEPSPPAGPAAP